MSDTLIWVGRDQLTKGRKVYMFQGLQAVPISDPALERLLEPASLTDVRAIPRKIQGHQFYILSLVSSGLTFAYDLELGEWYYWTSATGTVWPSHFVATDGARDYELLDGLPIVRSIEPSLYQDSGSSFAVEGQTNPIDGGTDYNKFCRSLTFVGDRSVSTVTVFWSDDDYQSFSSGRSVNLNLSLKTINRLGSFRRRAFLWSHFANAPFRQEALTLLMDVGVS
jgi:hypothetical protein